MAGPHAECFATHLSVISITLHYEFTAPNFDPNFGPNFALLIAFYRRRHKKIHKYDYTLFFAWRDDSRMRMRTPHIRSYHSDTFEKYAHQGRQTITGGAPNESRITVSTG